jgi:hypothetical protein
MRSSSSSVDLEAVHIGEHEPLLEGMGDNLHAGFEPLEMVADEQEISPRIPRRSPNLYQQIQTFLILLAEIQDAVNEQNKPRTSKQRFYTVLFLSTLLTSITSPGILLGAFLKDMNNTLGKYRLKWQEEIASLELQEKPLVDMTNALNEVAAPFRSTLFSYLKSFYENWFSTKCSDYYELEWSKKFDPKEARFVTNEFCHAADSASQSHDLDCYEIANGACKILKSHGDTVATIDRLDSEILDISKSSMPIHLQIETLQWKIKNGYFPDEAFNWPLFAAALSIGTISLCLIAVVASKFKSSYTQYKHQTARLHQANQCMPELAQSQDMTNLLQRLNINLADDMPIEVLIAQLQAKAEEIKYRHECRKAFTSGSVRPGTAIHRFFHHGGHHDVQNLIFEKADLGFKPRPQ